jgi:hypothetical protein
MQVSIRIQNWVLVLLIYLRVGRIVNQRHLIECLSSIFSQRVLPKNVLYVSEKFIDGVMRGV